VLSPPPFELRCGDIPHARSNLFRGRSAKGCDAVRHNGAETGDQGACGSIVSHSATSFPLGDMKEEIGRALDSCAPVCARLCTRENPETRAAPGLCAQCTQCAHIHTRAACKQRGCASRAHARAPLREVGALGAQAASVLRNRVHGRVHKTGKWTHWVHRFSNFQAR